MSSMPLLDSGTGVVFFHAGSSGLEWPLVALEIAFSFPDVLSGTNLDVGVSCCCWGPSRLWPFSAVAALAICFAIDEGTPGPELL